MQTVKQPQGRAPVADFGWRSKHVIRPLPGPSGANQRNCVLRGRIWAKWFGSQIVSTARDIHNLALVGFMGTGKSSVGQLVAAQLHFRFVDTDELIEARAGKTISAIFAEEGELPFREY